MTPSTQQQQQKPAESVPLHRWTGIATVLGLVVALLAWLLPKQQQEKPAPATAPATTATTAATKAPPAVEAAVFLDDDRFTPEAGADRLSQIPRAVRSDAAYATHPIVIGCPSNQTGDQSAEVTYPLRGRYARLDATVRPYYPPGVDQEAVTHVTVLAGVLLKDGTIATSEAGRQKGARPGGAEPLTAGVEGAEKLTVRVECSEPDGTVVLSEARLTR
ncbi:hypothetical protein [Paractinoplanes atraurantiacus]|uniref:hypothetical protein n=1 Tax=Paractinoplanes atraurantiacus TaxID=1036182 RepID=UPI000BE48022|nr:hypothetical protein [Actinoplanes atraurantiacus]